jgi:hypothetical protein
MASFRSEAEAFPGMSGMAEGHDRYARGLKPRALDRGVVHFETFLVAILSRMAKRSQKSIELTFKFFLCIVLRQWTGQKNLS